MEQFPVEMDGKVLDRRIRAALTPSEYRAQADDLQVTVSMLMFAQDFIETHGLHEQYEAEKAKQDFDNYGEAEAVLDADQPEEVPEDGNG